MLTAALVLAHRSVAAQEALELEQAVVGQERSQRIAAEEGLKLHEEVRRATAGTSVNIVTVLVVMIALLAAYCEPYWM